MFHKFLDTYVNIRFCVLMKSDTNLYLLHTMHKDSDLVSVNYFCVYDRFSDLEFYFI